MTSEALTDESQLRSTMQGIGNFIKNFLRGPWFVRPLDASPNSIVTYARRQRHMTLTEHEDVEDEAWPSQPAPTRRTRHRNDDEAGPSQQQTQLNSPILPPHGRGRSCERGQRRRALLWLFWYIDMCV